MIISLGKLELANKLTEIGS